MGFPCWESRKKGKILQCCIFFDRKSSEDLEPGVKAARNGKLHPCSPCPIVSTQWGIYGRQAPLILGKKEEMTEGRKASRASKSTPPPPPLLAQGLNPPLSRSNSVMTQYLKYLSLGTMCNKTNLKQ